MIARKIERLDEVDRKLLVAASVQGHEFDSAVVAEAIEMDPAEVEERLDALENVHVFVKRTREHEFPDLTLSLQYQFVHVLYQNALYGTLQPTRRAWLSGRVARALVMHHQGEHAAIAAGSPRSSNRRAISARAPARGTPSVCSRFARRCRSPSAGLRCCAGCRTAPSGCSTSWGSR